MTRGIFTVRSGLWQSIRKQVYEREKGICQNCGLPVEKPEGYGTTDRPGWTIHHKVPVVKLRQQAREKCKEIAGWQYVVELRRVFTEMYTDMTTLELRCKRPQCDTH